MFDILLVFVKKLFVVEFVCCANAAFKNSVRKLVSTCAYSCVSGSDILRVMYKLSLNLMDFTMPIVIQVHFFMFVFFKSD